MTLGPQGRAAEHPERGDEPHGVEPETPGRPRQERPQAPRKPRGGGWACEGSRLSVGRSQEPRGGSGCGHIPTVGPPPAARPEPELSCSSPTPQCRVRFEEQVSPLPVHMQSPLPPGGPRISAAAPAYSRVRRARGAPRSAARPRPLPHAGMSSVPRASRGGSGSRNAALGDSRSSPAPRSCQEASAMRPHKLGARA